MRLDRAGVAYAVAAFGLWGLVPLFWKLLTAVPAWEILLHRATFALPVFVAVALAGGQLGAARDALRSRPGAVAASAALLAANWLSFLIAIETGHVLDVSLGYFLNPLLSVLLGRVVLGETLDGRRAIAVAFAAAGVAVLCTQASAIPWTGLVVAGTFGAYGLVRKTSRVAAVPGSTAEILVLGPVALIALVALRGDLVGPSLGARAWLLPVTGLVTALPLWWFAEAVRRLPLGAVGFFQFLAPTGQFLLATLVFGEPFLASVHLPGFGLIWVGVLVFLSRR